MFGHKSVNDIPVFSEGSGGADLVEAHKPRVASYIGG